MAVAAGDSTPCRIRQNQRTRIEQVGMHPDAVPERGPEPARFRTEFETVAFLKFMIARTWLSAPRPIWATRIRSIILPLAPTVRWDSHPGRAGGQSARWDTFPRRP